MKLTDYLFEGTDEILDDIEKAFGFTRDEAKVFIRRNLKKIASYKLGKYTKDEAIISKIKNNEDISLESIDEYVELFNVALHTAAIIKVYIVNKNVPNVHYDKPILDSDYEKTIDYLTSIGLSFTEFDYDPKTEDSDKWRKIITIKGFKLLNSDIPTSITMKFYYEDESLCDIFCGGYSCFVKTKNLEDK